MGDGRFRGTPPKIPGVRARRRTDARGVYWTFEVRWTDPATNRKLAEQCATPDDAEDFKAQVRLMKRRGVLAELDRGRETLDEFAVEWLEKYAAVTLAKSTLKGYASTYNLHVSPYLGHMELRQVRPRAIDQLRQTLADAGVGNPTIRKSLAILSSMLSQAVTWERVDANAARSVRKPRAKRSKVIVPLSIAEVEALVNELRERDAEWLLAELLAYGAARPQDALALGDASVGEQRLVYAYKNVDGVILPGAKTGEDKSRSVGMLRHLKADIRRRQLARPPSPLGLLVVRADGAPWREHDYKNWCTKRPRGRQRASGAGRTGALGPFTEAARAVGRPDITPYFLRHTYASLRIAEQRLSLQEIAEEMGHSVQVLAEHYAHVISEYAGQGPIDPDDLIARARRGESSTPTEARHAQ